MTTLEWVLLGGALFFACLALGMWIGATCRWHE
jgi:hypothetical protein